MHPYQLPHHLEAPGFLFSHSSQILRHYHCQPFAPNDEGSRALETAVIQSYRAEWCPRTQQSEILCLQINQLVVGRSQTGTKSSDSLLFLLRSYHHLLLPPPPPPPSLLLLLLLKSLLSSLSD